MDKPLLGNRLAALAALVVLVLPLTPAVPASPLAGSCVGYPNMVASDTFTVPAGEVRVFSEPTAIQARAITIAGALLTRDGDGDDAPALCLETERLAVSAAGVVCTGNGEDGASFMGTNAAQGGDGTDGGALTILLRDNPATLAAPSLNVLGLVCTGDGGAGGMAMVEPCLPAVLGIEDSAIPTCAPEESDSDACAALGESPLVSRDVCPDAEPCLPASLGIEDAAIPTCPEEPGCDPASDECLPPVCGASCPEPCLPARLGITDSTIPTCPEDPVCPDREDCDPCASCPEPCSLVNPCPVNVCDVPMLNRAYGGDAGDGGLLALQYTLPVAPATLKAGKGGDGGDAYTFGGLRGANEAHGGLAGSSLVAINGALPSGPWLALLGASEGGHGGSALAGPAPECGGNEACKDPIFENRTYCALRDAMKEVCKTSPHQGTICDPANDIFRDRTGKELYGSNSGTDTDTPVGPDPADPGYDGADASAGESWQISCGFSVTPVPPFGAPGCGASAACGTGYPALTGFYGEPGYSGAAALANASQGGYGVIKGGDGGSATATGAKGGDGGPGGDGGDGAASCDQEHNGAPGAKGGRGGVGGMATAKGGLGGASEVQGGKGGDAQANMGPGGAGGQGGNGGEPEDGCNPYTGACDAFFPGSSFHTWGGYWGCGGGGGGRGGAVSVPGRGGRIESSNGYGPDGADIPGTIPPPYGPTGLNGAEYLPAPACPV